MHVYFLDGSASGSDLSPHSHTLTMNEFRSGGGSSSSAYDIPTAYSSGGGGGSTRSQPTAGWMNTLSNRSTAASKRSSGTGGSQGI